VKRRLVAVLAALLSAALGGALLLTYVAGADRRAMAGMEPVQVLVATKAVPAGTTGTALADLVKVKTLPAAALAPEAVRDVSTLAGLVSTVDLVPGEQVLASRFVDPATLAPAPPSVPKGKQQISIDVEPQRLLGGDVAPGARVAVFTTIEKATSLAVRSALVVRIDLAPASTGKDDAVDAPTAPTDGRVRVTLAMTGAEARRLVAGANSGAVWFSLVSTAPRTPASGTAPTAATAPVRSATS
jgi:pilus assembly protein CpaB